MISVCIATYNGEKYIRQQIESILIQLDGDDEIIISDNLSTDSTASTILLLNDSRIKLFFENKSGVVKNFENALNQARGDYIFLADQDDIWLPDKVSTVMKEFDRFDLVLHDAIVVDHELSTLNDSLFKYNNSRSGIIKNIYKNCYVGCCMAFRKKVLLKATPFPNSLPMHDWWIGLVAESYFTPILINSKLIMYRRHSDNYSDTSGKSSHNFLNKLKWRLTIILNILKLLLSSFNYSEIKRKK